MEITRSVSAEVFAAKNSFTKLFSFPRKSPISSGIKKDVGHRTDSDKVVPHYIDFRTPTFISAGDEFDDPKAVGILFWERPAF